jgi:hypothetical protein
MVGSYKIPVDSPLSTNVFYRIILTVTDTNGYEQSVFTDVFPLLGSPTVSAAQSGGGITISWPQWAGTLELYTTTNLADTDWTLVTNTPASSNNLFSITIPATNFMQFYRLQSPP